MADVAQVLFVSPHTVLYITFIYLMLKWINYLRVWVIVCRLCESVREKERVCVCVCVCVDTRAHMCALEREFALIPRFHGDSITQSGGHGCRDRPEKHQQELRLNSCERNRERDVTKLDCSHYNQHSYLMWNQMNDLVLSHGTACVTIATSSRRHIIFSSLLKRSSATNRQKIIHLKWYIYINNSRLHYACATNALAVVYFQHATAMIVIIIILCI